jgi:hypothetical protein
VIEHYAATIRQVLSEPDRLLDEIGSPPAIPA